MKNCLQIALFLALIYAPNSRAGFLRASPPCDLPEYLRKTFTAHEGEATDQIPNLRNIQINDQNISLIDAKWKKLGEGNYGAVYRLEYMQERKPTTLLLKKYKAPSHAEHDFKWLNFLKKEEDRLGVSVATAEQTSDPFILKIQDVRGKALNELLADKSIPKIYRKQLKKRYLDLLKRAHRLFQEAKFKNTSGIFSDGRLFSPLKRFEARTLPTRWEFQADVIIHPENIIVDLETGRFTLIDPR